MTNHGIVLAFGGVCFLVHVGLLAKEVMSAKQSGFGPSMWAFFWACLTLILTFTFAALLK